MQIDAKFSNNILFASEEIPILHLLTFRPLSKNTYNELQAPKGTYNLDAQSQIILENVFKN